MFPNNGDGTFVSQLTYATNNQPKSIISSDFNNDEKLDLVVANYQSSTISVLLGNGDGTFRSQIVLATDTSPVSVIADWIWQWPTTGV